MVRKTFFIGSVLVLFFFLTAMGGGRNSGFDRAPRVEKNYSVSVTDISGIKLEGEKFSWEARTHFSGNMGMANVVIPFDKIKQVTFGEKRDKKVRTTLHLKDGTETTFDIDADSRCYGDANFGSFMLTVGEIKSVLFK